MALPQLEKLIMGPEERSQFEQGSALRSMKWSHGRYKGQHLRGPSSEAEISDDELADMAIGYAEKDGGTPEEIERKAFGYLDLLQSERKRRVEQQGMRTLKAIKKGAAETPYTVQLTPEQAEAAQKGDWFRTEEQAKLKLVKSGAIPPEEVRRFMIGEYTPETKRKLDALMATPQAGPPEKFEGEETSMLGSAVSKLFDVLSAGGRFAAGGKAVSIKDLRESGQLDKIAKGQGSLLAFTDIISAAKGAGKAAIKAEDAPNLEAEIIKTRDHLLDLAIDEAMKELPGFSEKDIEDLAEHKFNQYAENLGLFTDLAMEHPSKAATAYQIAGDPLMYAGAAPYKAVTGFAGGLAKGAIPTEAQAWLAQKAAKGLGWISYESQFLPLEIAGEKGKELAQTLKFVETNMAPGHAAKFDRIMKEIHSLDKRIKPEHKELFFSVIHRDKPISALPKEYEGILTRAQDISDEVFDLRHIAGSAQTMGKRRKVKAATYLEDYGTPLTKQEKGFEGGRKSMYRGTSTSTTRHRTGKGEPVKDFKKQWDATLEAESRAAQAAITYRGVKEATTEAQAWQVFRPTKKGQTIEDALTGAAADAEKLSGVKFVALNEKLSEKVLKVTSRPGDKIWKDSQIILPEPAANAIKRAAYIADPEQSMKSFGDLYRAIIRPLQNIWRIKATVLRSAQFQATNFVGAAGLGGVAHGIRALNPNLQGGAIRTAAQAAFGGSDDALNVMFKLRLDKAPPGYAVEAPLGELFEIMQETAVLGQFRKRYAMDMVSKGPAGTIKEVLATRGPFGAAEEVYRKIPELIGRELKSGKKINIQTMAAFGDEYQHAVVFLGALKSTKPQHIMEAADFTAKFAGNYNRLTQWERTIFKEIAGFYTWNRFILPHVVKQIFENPQRISMYEKLKSGWEEFIGDNRPVLEAGVPQWMKGQTAGTAPSWAQPEDAHNAAMWVMESPQNTLGSLVDEGATSFALGPGASAMIEMITGNDLKTGRPRQDLMPYVPDMFEGYRGTVRELAESVIPFGEALGNIERLYWGVGQYDRAAELHLRYRVARDWLNLDRLIQLKMPLSIPILTKPFVFQPTKVGARKKRRASGR